jgi:hypothetical protein
VNKKKKRKKEKKKEKRGRREGRALESSQEIEGFERVACKLKRCQCGERSARTCAELRLLLQIPVTGS